MKLKNKKTGEIVEVESLYLTQTQELYLNYINEENKQKVYMTDKIASFNLDWEDYEEPKDFWYIDDFMIMCGTEGEFTTPDLASFTKKDIEKLKEIGNYFESKEEAEKALKKLKAFKRLKDNGMIKYSFHKEKTGIDLDFYTLTILAPRDKDSLDLLFGGEE